jgi:DNA polymerase-3 subunit gamma/tau
VEYQALYRKYRPQTFEDVIGQGHVTATLAREVAEDHVAHAYLFAGPRGTGKTTTARILAKALNCSNRNPDGSPDNRCESCIAVTEGTSLDVLELDAASHNSVDDIREMRVSVSTVASASGAKRVFILDEAHMLSKAAGNALLKTLEEPPAGVHFVLATTEPYKLLDTIRSRSQRFDFHTISVEALAAHLSRISESEGYRADPPALVAVARHALGSARDSLSLLEQVAALGNGTVDLTGVTRALGLADADAFTTLATAIGQQDARTALELVARLSSQGADLRRFASESIAFFRGAFLAHYAPNLVEIADEPAEVLAAWKNTASTLGSSDVLRAVDLLGDTLLKLREGREERLMLELAVIKLTRPETASDPAAVVSRVERMERKLATGVAAPAGPAAEVPVEAPPAVEPAAVAPEPEQAAAPPAEAVTMARFEEIWPALFGGLRDLLGARRWALFRETEPGAAEGSTLVVGVRYDFHLKALQDDGAVAKIVATRAGDLLGFPVEVAFRMFQSDGAVAPAEPERLDDIDLAPEGLVDVPADDPTDPFKLVTEQLGAQVIEEYDEEDGAGRE